MCWAKIFYGRNAIFLGGQNRGYSIELMLHWEYSTICFVSLTLCVLRVVTCFVCDLEFSGWFIINLCRVHFRCNGELVIC